LAQITAIFWDVGGVLLTNAWDHNERREAIARFSLDEKDFEQRHESAVNDFERGKLTLQEYLNRTVFYQNRPFTHEAFQQFMFSRSRSNPEALAFARGLAASRRYLMSSINNESQELNEFRIRQFRLREIFLLFVSSCSVGLRKPQPEIYQLALNLTQRTPDECCFIDDRQENLEPARRLGMHCIRMQGVKNLEDELNQLGVKSA
jgi:putative hydrolase of the HAD superfamily